MPIWHFKFAAPRSRWRNYAITTRDRIDRGALQLVTNCDKCTGRRTFKVTICDLEGSQWMEAIFLHL